MTKLIGQIAFGPKDLHFLIEAVEFRLAWYNANIPSAPDENTRGDMENDAGLLDSILKTLQAERDAWNKEVARRAGSP
jgi:hypothetical protein